MTHRLVALTVASLAFLAPMHAPAQGLRLPSGTSLTLPEAQRSADYIVAVVNSEPITNNEVRQELLRAQQQLTQQGQSVTEALTRQVLENLINQKVQLQLARESGIRVDDAAVELAEQSIARQNGIDVPELHRRLASEGVQLAQLRARLREQLMLVRLRERDVESRLRVSDLEVEQYLQERQRNNDPATQELNLAQILVTVPSSASADQLAALQARAQRLLERARAGDDFGALAREFSDGSERAGAGVLGLRTANRYPALFLQATQDLEVGDISALVRSGAGFHILKVLDKQRAGLPAMTVAQSRARHILLRPGPKLSEAAARVQLSEFKQRLEAGRSDFATLAREHSQDGSAAQGGDLGWASPGMFVPEFEAVMDQLAPGQISAPLVSRFGVHLIEVTERRSVALNAREQADAVRALLREKKLAEDSRSWAQELRGRAYVELREPPQ